MNADKFLKVSISVVFVIFLIIASLYVISVISQKVFISILIAGFIASLNFFSSLFFIKSGINKPQNAFLKIVFGGMLLRFLATLILVIISLIFLDISQNSFIFSILFFYILYLIIEVLYLNFRRK